MIRNVLENIAALGVIGLLICAIGVWSLFFADFDGSERPTCKAGSVAALFTDCEIAQ